MSDYVLEGVLKLRDETRKATDSASKGVGNLQNVLKVAGAAMAAFGVQQVALELYTFGGPLSSVGIWMRAWDLGDGGN